MTVLSLLHSGALPASQTPEPEWRSYLHALGQPSWIGANAGHDMANGVFRPIPAPEWSVSDARKAELGASLYHEGRLSSGNSIACVTCHAGALSGADRRSVSTGVGGARGTMNALSVFNAAYNFRQFWDGRVVTLEDQALVPIQDAAEMAHTLDGVLTMLTADTHYPERFDAVYPDGVTISNVADAIAHFQRHTFVRRDTPFQRYLNGASDALGEQALRGKKRFRALGCVNCHNGINLGGNSYQRLGEVIPYYDAHREAGPADMGVMNRTGLERDRHLFKVPGLHGVATTAPYFHDGSVPTLNEAISLMGKHQLGRQLSQQDVDEIAAFLRSLGDHFSRTGSLNETLSNTAGD